MTPNTPALPSASTELAAIRDALAELPAETLGTWRKLDKLPYIHVTEDPKASPWGTPCIGRFDYMDTADYMVACNPAAMTAVLAYVDTLQAEIQALRADARPVLAVWFGSMPESNGKRNWTVLLYRRDAPGGFTSGITIERTEYYDRARYEADRLSYLIGESSVEPSILDYDSNLKEPLDAAVSASGEGK